MIKHRETENAAAGNAAATVPVTTNYQRLPEGVGAKTEDYAYNANSIGKTLDVTQKNMVSAKKDFDDAQQTMIYLQEIAQMMKKAYEQNPNKYNYDRYVKACEKCDLQVDAMDQTQRKYEETATIYKQTYDSYAAAAKTHDDYVAEQKKIYDTWRGSIRDSGTVQADLDKLGTQIETYRQNDPQDAAGGLQGLLDTRALLEEELDWSDYFANSEAMDAVYQKQNETGKTLEQNYIDATTAYDKALAAHMDAQFATEAETLASEKNLDMLYKAAQDAHAAYEDWKLSGQDQDGEQSYYGDKATVAALRMMIREMEKEAAGKEYKTEEDLLAAEEEINRLYDAYQMAWGAYEDNPSEENRKAYEDAKAAYESLSYTHDGKRALDIRKLRMEYDYRNELLKIQEMDKASQAALKDYAKTGKQAMLAYLMQKGYTEEQIKRYAETWRRYENELAMKRTEASAGRAAQTPILGTVQSWISQAIGTLTGTVESLGQGMKVATGYQRYVDTNAAGYRPGAWASTVQQDVLEKIQNNQNTSQWLNNVAGYGYQALNTTANTLANIGMGAMTGSALVTNALFFMGSAQQTFREKSAAGADVGSAMLMGMVSGALELLTEKYSLDNLLKLKNVPGWKNALKNVAAQAAVEVSEEEMSFLGNLLAEAVILGENSDLNRRIRELQEGGMSEKDAKEQAHKELWEEACHTAIVAAMSGAGMAGGKLALDKMQNHGAKQTYTDAELKSVIEKALAEADRVEKATPLVTPENTDREQADMEFRQPVNADGTHTAPEVESMEISGNDPAGASVETSGAVHTEEQGSKPVEPGTVAFESVMTQVKPEVYQQAKRLAEATGIHVRFFTKYATDEGIDNGRYEDGIIYINTESADPVAQIFAHELTHSLEQTKEYHALKRLVLRRITSSGGNMEVLREAKKKLYAKNGIKLRDNTAIDAEIVAEHVAEYLLTDEQAIQETVQKDPGLGRRILNWLNEMLSRLRNPNAQEAAYLRRVRDLYAAALKKSQNDQTLQQRSAARQEDARRASQETREWAQQAYQDGRLSEQTLDKILDALDQQEDLDVSELSLEQELAGLREEKKGQHYIRETFAAEIDAWDGKAEKTFHVGTTSDALKNIGVKDKGIIWHSAKIAKIMQKHGGMTKPVIKQVPDILEHPVAVLASRQSDTRLVIFGTVYDANGDPVTAILELQPTTRGGQVLDMTVIASAYGKEGNVARFVEESGLVYLDPDIKRTKSWMQGLGLQLPSDATAFGSIGTVTYPDGKVKIESVPYKQYMQNASKNAGSGQHSISAPARQDIVRDLRSILERGGDPAELRRYVDSLEQNAHGVEQNTQFADQNGAEAGQTARREERTADAARKILQAARDEGLSVEEYLSQNWELYEVDGQWDVDARAALELERRESRAKHSISKPAGVDKTTDGSDNGATETIDGGNKYDNRRVREGSARDAGNSNPTGSEGVDRGADTGNAERTQRLQGWKELDSGVRKKISRLVRSHIRNSSNRVELYYYLINSVGRNDGNITPYMYNKAVDILCSEIYSSYKNEHKAVFENKWKILGGSISDIHKGIRSAMEEAGDSEEAKHSISKPAAKTQEDPAAEEQANETAENTADVRSVLPKKARDYLKRAERKLLNKVGQSLGVPYLAKRDVLTPIIQEISDEYLRNGTISQEKAKELFDRAYEEGIVVDREFYDQYKDLKRHLQTSGITLHERYHDDIADYSDFVRRAFGAVKIVKEGGLPVDSAYQELQEMAPELFPKDILHPADQLVRIVDVARSIRIAERSLNEFYGEEADAFRKDAQHNFEEAIGDVVSELKRVKRYHESRLTEEDEAPPTTPEEAMEAYKDLKAARRKYEKVRAKNLLTDHDDMQLGRLLRGEIELQHLDPNQDNVEGITAVYEAKEEYAQILELLIEYKKGLRAKQKNLADSYLESTSTWKDKKMGLEYSRETMTRNITDIIPDRELAKQIIQEYIEPVAVAEAKATRMKNDYRQRIKDLHLSRKVEKGNLVSESHAVQLLGEAMDNIKTLENSRGRIKEKDGKKLSEWREVVENLWAENPNLDKAKIQDAVRAFRKIYEDLFVLMNEVRVRNGYEPINYRKGYFPHFQPGESDGILAKFGKAIGVDTGVEALPTTISGLTHTFKPGIQWFGNAQERLGFNTAYDAVEGFDRYIEGATGVICQTDNIQKLRALASQIRYRTSSDGIRERVDQIYANDTLNDEEKQGAINELYARGGYELSNFVNELDEYTNILANKKSKLDRTVESLAGRKFYTLMSKWEGRVGANMVGANMSSALTNYIPLTQAAARLGKLNLVKGMVGTLRSVVTQDGMIEASAFLTNRKGSDPLIRSIWEKGANITGKPFEWIDGFTAGSIVRGAYYQNLQRGLSEEDAAHQADLLAASVMADRSKGAMPTLFASRNPAIKLFSQFQLEVNNQISEFTKDLPREMLAQGKRAYGWALFKYLVSAYLFNQIFKWLFGREPAFDPIGWIVNFAEDTAEDGIGSAITGLGTNVLEDLPFTSALTLLGLEMDGGRVPVSSSIPNLNNIISALTNGEWDDAYRWKVAKDELNKLAYVIPPFGGGQASKAIKGLKAYIEGGSYSVNTKGEEILQYPVYKENAAEAVWAAIRSFFLGKNSSQEAQEWVESGFDSLNPKQTTVYRGMVEAGVSQRKAYDLIGKIEDVPQSEGQKAERVKVLRESGVSREGMAVVYYGLLASKSEREIMDALTALGADSVEVAEVMMEIYDTNALKGSEGTKAERQAIIDAELSDEEKILLVGDMMGTDMETESGNPSQYAKFLKMLDAGVSVDDYLKFRNNDGKADNFLKLVQGGISADDALELSMQIDNLEPIDGAEKVEDVQRWRTCINYFGNPQWQLSALSTEMTDAQYAKVNLAYDFGVDPEDYIKYHEIRAQFDENGNGSYSSAEVKAALDSMKLDADEKAAMWQIVTGSKSAKNNPYSTRIGQLVLEAKASK